MQLSKKYILITLIVLISLVVGLIVLFHPQGKIKFTIAPSEATMTINVKKRTIHHNETISLAPGTHVITFSRDGFSTEEKTVTVNNQETTNLVIALSPLTDEAKKILSDSPDAQKITTQYEQQNFDELINSLPASGVGYSLSSCPSLKNPQSTKKILCVSTDNTLGKEAVLQALAQRGINLSRHEILFGTDNAKQVVSTENYEIDYYPNLLTTKPALYITPLQIDNADTTPSAITKLETLRQTALDKLTDLGYDPKNYDIRYSNGYLSKYNPIDSEEEDHAEVPIR